MICTHEEGCDKVKVAFLCTAKQGERTCAEPFKFKAIPVTDSISDITCVTCPHCGMNFYGRDANLAEEKYDIHKMKCSKRPKPKPKRKIKKGKKNEGKRSKGRKKRKRGI
jgi:hypothetical protein